MNEIGKDKKIWKKKKERGGASVGKLSFVRKIFVGRGGAAPYLYIYDNFFI